MERSVRIKKRLRAWILPAVCACAIAYVGYHTLEGRRGLKIRSQLVHKIEVTTIDGARLKIENDRLNHRVNLLREGRINRDLLDESMRRMLNYGHPSERVLLYQTPIGSPSSR